MSAHDGDSVPLPSTEAQGELFLYTPWGLAAFEVGGSTSSKRALVCLGGLTDGLLSLRYLPTLAEGLRKAGWRVVQPVLSSSYRGWGVSSLQSDADDLDQLIRFLRARRGVEEVALLGSSTGCQDIVWYLEKGQEASRVLAAILQAPVSDRESLAGKEEALRQYRSDAAALIAEGRGDEVMPRAAGQLFGPDDPVSAYRFDSLTGRLTDDDMFSSDLSDAELQRKLGHVAVPTLLVGSADDEYVPSFVDTPKLLERIAGATAVSSIGGAEVAVIEKGGHGLQAEDAGLQLRDLVCQFLVKHLDPSSAMGKGSLCSCMRALALDLRAKAGEAAGAPAGAAAAGAAEAAESERRPLLVAFVGMPGSGKTTGATLLGKLLGKSCVVLGMDGFHVPLSDLQTRPDAEEAVYRRGAPDTFDPVGLQKQLQLIADKAGPEEVDWPGFDHAVGDPVEREQKFIRSQHKIVVVEGLYLLLEDGAWAGTKELFDHRVYLETDLELCISRVKERNKVIPGYTPEEIEARCERVDRANAVIVRGTSVAADRIVSLGVAA